MPKKKKKRKKSKTKECIHFKKKSKFYLSNQTLIKLVFSPLFSSPFSIIPTKRTLSIIHRRELIFFFPFINFSWEFGINKHAFLFKSWLRVLLGFNAMLSTSWSHREEIIVYFWSTINAYFLFLHKWWVLLIKFMVGLTIYVRGESTHLWYSRST